MNHSINRGEIMTLQEMREALTENRRKVYWINIHSRLYFVENEVRSVRARLDDIEKKFSSGDIAEIKVGYKELSNLCNVIISGIYFPECHFKKRTTHLYSIEKVYVNSKLFARGLFWENPDLIKIDGILVEHCYVLQKRIEDSGLKKILTERENRAISRNIKDTSINVSLNEDDTEVIMAGNRKSGIVICRIGGALCVVEQSGKLCEIRNLFKCILQAVDFWDGALNRCDKIGIKVIRGGKIKKAIL